MASNEIEKKVDQALQKAKTGEAPKVPSADERARWAEGEAAKNRAAIRRTNDK